MCVDVAEGAAGVLKGLAALVGWPSFDYAQDEVCWWPTALMAYGVDGLRCCRSGGCSRVDVAEPKVGFCTNASTERRTVRRGYQAQPATAAAPE